MLSTGAQPRAFQQAVLFQWWFSIAVVSGLEVERLCFCHSMCQISGLWSGNCTVSLPVLTDQQGWRQGHPLESALGLHSALSARRVRTPRTAVGIWGFLSQAQLEQEADSTGQSHGPFKASSTSFLIPSGGF